MFGIYIHWPFCLSKCIYCDFNSSVLSKKNNDLICFQKQYCECCKKQLLYFSKKIQKNIYQHEITSIYFGGGTPSLLSPDNISSVLSEINNLFCFSKKCEITLEANPTSFELDKFYQFSDAGINRLSLGVQSFDDNELLWLGRKHSVEQAINAIEKIKNIFSYWSFDLIYGLPKQSLNKWLDELKLALSLRPKHLSLYTLIVDKKTPLGKLVSSGNIVPKTEDELSIFYDATNDFIKHACAYKNESEKLKQYEVSNYATEGNRSIHNCCYWNSYDYIGIGPMAHGRITYKNEKRYETLCKKSINNWFADLENNKNGLSVEKKLTEKEQAEEILLMGLRICDGIDFADIYKRFHLDLMKFLNQDELEFFEKNNFLSFKDRVLKLKYSGLKILNIILEKLLKQ